MLKNLGSVYKPSHQSAERLRCLGLSRPRFCCKHASTNGSLTEGPSARPSQAIERLTSMCHLFIEPSANLARRLYLFTYAPSYRFSIRLLLPDVLCDSPKILHYNEQNE